MEEPESDFLFFLVGSKVDVFLLPSKIFTNRTKKKLVFKTLNFACFLKGGREEQKASEMLL